MSRKLDSPVQTQMSVSVLRTSLGKEYHGSKRMEDKQLVQRKVFVQIDNGHVLGMELDRTDNAHTVKRRLQVALNVPTDESSLIFGDTVLKNDLSVVPNDCPLFLTRNLMHRSSSTPCLSPTGKDLQHRDRSGPVEIIGHSDCFSKTKQLVKEVVKGIKTGVDPIPVHNGLGGAYYFRNKRGNNVAVVKPTDEEPFAPNNPKGFVGKALGQPGLKRSVRVGETGYREVAAYLLDHEHFANVPPTSLVKITHSIFNVNDGMIKPQKKNLVSKIASFQQFVPHDFDASDYGTSSFPVSSVHRIGILDIRIFNTDRHAGNVLVRKLDRVGRFGQVELIPIDHGLSLPETLEDPYFEWIHWPQASIPFSDDELKYIGDLNPDKDCEMLKKELPMVRQASLRVLVLCTIFLKEAASFGLCLSEIGEMMSREFRSGEEEPSELEKVCMEARQMIIKWEVLLSPKTDWGSEEFQFDLDCEESELDQFRILEEEEEEGEDSEGEEPKQGGSVAMQFSKRVLPNISNLSTSLQNTILGEKNRKHVKCYPWTRPENGLVNSGLSERRSANEQLPPSVSFVKVEDLTEDEWSLFLVKFQELLHPALDKWKFTSLSQKQRQRLGTSCKF